jgi:predicted phage terminase large subunit-like protein
MLAGFPVAAESISGDKETRAFNFAAQVNAGNVRLIQAPWNKAFIEELRAFPMGTHDDQVDAVADAFNRLAGTQPVRFGTFRM